MEPVGTPGSRSRCGAAVGAPAPSPPSGSGTRSSSSSRSAMSRADERSFVDSMVAKVLAREARTATPRGDEALRDRAAELGRPHLAPVTGDPPAPTDVRWVGNQQPALGLLHPGDRGHPALRPAAADAGLGRRLRPGPRAGPPRRAQPLRRLLARWSRATPTPTGPGATSRATSPARASRGGRPARRTSRTTSGTDGVPTAPEPGPRRAVLVLARHGAGAAAPPGVDPEDLARAALADTYEVVADLVGVRSGIAGDDVPRRPALAGRAAPARRGRAADLAAALAGEADELVLVPGDAPDLPGLVLAKVFKVLHRSDVVLAPERGGTGLRRAGRPAAARRLAGPAGPRPRRPRPGGRARRGRAAAPAAVQTAPGLAPAALAGGAGPARPRAGGLGGDARAAPRRRRPAGPPLRAGPAGGRRVRRGGDPRRRAPRRRAARPGRRRSPRRTAARPASPVDEAQRVVEVRGGRHQVGVGPDRVAALGPAGLADGGPEVGRVAQPARPQLQPHEGREGGLGRPAARAASAGRSRPAAPAAGIHGAVAWVTTSSTQPSTRASIVSSRSSVASCSGVFCGSNSPPSSVALSSSRLVGSICPTGLLQRGGVDGDAGRVLLDQHEHLLAQPAGGGEQPLPGALAQGEVEGDVGALCSRPSPKAATLVGSSATWPGSLSGRPMSVAPTTSAASWPRPWPSCRPNIEAPELRSIGRSICSIPAIPGMAAGLVAAEAERALHRVGDVAGDRLDQPAPDAHRALDPLGAAPGRDGWC